MSSTAETAGPKFLYTEKLEEAARSRVSASVKNALGQLGTAEGYRTIVVRNNSIDELTTVVDEIVYSLDSHQPPRALASPPQYMRSENPKTSYLAVIPTVPMEAVPPHDDMPL